MKAKDEDLQVLAKAVKKVFRDNRGEFSLADFVQVAGLLGFHAFEKAGSRETLKPVAENYLPDIISTNLQYARERKMFIMGLIQGWREKFCLLN